MTTDERVAVIHDGCKDTPGGAAKVSVELARVLDADMYVGRTGCRGWYVERAPHKLSVYAPRSNSFPSLLRDANVAYQTGKLHLPEYDVVVTTGVTAKFYQPESFQRHVHYTHHPPLWYAQWLGRDSLSGIRGNLRYGMRKLGMYVDWLEMQRIETVLANSETTRSRIRRHYRRETTVVNPPISYSDAPVLSGDERDDYYLYAGRLGERKRLQTLVEAFGQTDQRLVVAGDGLLRDELSSLANARDADVDFRGFVDEDELERLMRRAQCGVFVPEEEDFGMAIAELLCWGTPLIVSDEPNPRYMVSDDDGVRVSPTTDAVAQAVATFDRSEYDYHDVADRARAQYSAERFTKEARKAVLGLEDTLTERTNE
jgi:glycosyltransferase involved in cell wall biosynthesis